MALILGMILDAIFGEPKWLWSRMPHPAVLMGRAIGWCDRSFNRGDTRKRNGIVTVVALCLCAGTVGWIIMAVPGIVADVIVIGVLLAQRSLVQHVQAVGDALRLSIGDARLAVAQIVGRDTSQMDGPAIARAAMESAAENMSDGVIAPVFWCAVAGLPGLLIYKVVNTADSMIGYRTPEYREFGWAAARLDDVLNFIPARLTAILIWLVTSRPTLAKVFFDAPLHRWPNAGWPESALAHGIDVALSGPRSYGGRLQDDPFVNAEGNRDASADDIDRTIVVLWKTWGATVVLVMLAALV